MPTIVDVKNLKINKLTKQQYDLAVQGGVIGENELSVITDEEYTSMVTPSSMPVLLSSGWVSNEQTVNVTGVTTDNTVFVAPAPASADDYSAAGIICTAQGTGTLTFTCDTLPTNNITVNVVIFN